MLIDRKELIKAIKANPTNIVFFESDKLRSFVEGFAVKYPIQTGINGCFKTKELLKVLGAMKNDSLNIETDKNSLVVFDDVIKLELYGLPTDSTKEGDEVVGLQKDLKGIKYDNLEWKELPKDFKDAVLLCLLSIDREARSPLKGVAIHGHHMISTDNYRGSNYTFSSGQEFPELGVIPPTQLKSYLKVDENFSEYSMNVGVGWFHLKSPNGLILSLGINEKKNYPVEDFYNLSEKFAFSRDKEFQFPTELGRYLDVSYAFAGEGSDVLEDLKFISLSFQGETIILHAESELGKMDIKFSGKSPEHYKVRFNPLFLKHVINLTDKFYTSSVREAILLTIGSFEYFLLATVEK